MTGRDLGHHLALRQVTVADDALVAVLGLQIGMLAEKVCNLGLYRLGKQGTRPIAQDFGELILDVSWLNQLGALPSGRLLNHQCCNSVAHLQPPSPKSPSDAHAPVESITPERKIGH